MEKGQLFPVIFGFLLAFYMYSLQDINRSKLILERRSVNFFEKNLKTKDTINPNNLPWTLGWHSFMISLKPHRGFQQVAQ